MTATAEHTMQITTTFANGARKIRIAEEVEIGIDHNNHIYWATPEGWDWVIAPNNPLIRQRSLRVLGDATGWPSTRDSEFIWTGTL